MEFVPYCNTPAGLTLTPLQWQTIGIQTFAFDLLALLQRPGIELSLDLRKYTHCSGKIILDARAIEPNKNAQIIFRMPDGARKTISQAELDDWITHLNPDEIMVNNKLHLEKNQAKVIEDFQNDYWISDEPALKALQGEVICETVFGFNILDETFAQDHELLLKSCQCDTCQSGFTRSYLHHLLKHTPLLAQRFLVQHNVWQAFHSMN